MANLGELPSLLKKKPKVLKTATGGVSKRVPGGGFGLVSAEKTKKLKQAAEPPKEKEKMLLEGATADAAAERQVVEIPDAPPFLPIPKRHTWEHVLTADSVRANPNVAFPLTQSICLPEDLKQIPSEPGENITEMFAYLALASQSAVGVHAKFVAGVRANNELKKKLDTEHKRRKEAEVVAQSAATEVEVLRQKLEELQLKKEQEISDACNAARSETKDQIVTHYQGQVAKIDAAGFLRGAKAYYLQGVAKGYELGMDASHINVDLELRAVPEVDLPEIVVTAEEEEEEEEGEAEEEAGETPLPDHGTDVAH